MSAQLRSSLVRRPDVWVAPRSQPRGRVLLVSPQPFYEDRGTPIAVDLVSRSLASIGYEVDLLAFPIGQEVEIPGVTMHRSARVFGIRDVPIGFSAKKLALDAGLFRSLDRMIDTGRYDVVHAVEEAAYFASVLCASRRVPFIYDMASAIPVELERHAVLGTPLAQKLLKAVERRVIRSASQVLCSQGLGSRVRNIAPDTPVTEWRFPVSDALADPKRTAALREQIGIRPDEHVLMYAGNFSRYQGLDLLLDAFSIAARRHSRLTLLCLGAQDAASASQWQERLPADVRSRAHVLPRVPRQDVPDYLGVADTLVSIRPEGDNAPLKIFEYMVTGRPILATRGRAHEPLLNRETAFLCDCNAEDIASRVSDVMDDPSLAGRVAASARRQAKRQYSAERFDDLLLDVYQQFDSRTLRWDYPPHLAPPRWH